MPRIPFVCKCSEKREIIIHMFFVDIDYIFVTIIDRWNHVKSRAQVILHGIRNIFDLCMDSGQTGEISGDFGCKCG